MLNQWHAEEREVVLHRLGADAERGLAPAESTRRLREHGPNALSADRAPSGAGRRARQLLDPFALAPLVAAALCAWRGRVGGRGGGRCRRGRERAARASAASAPTGAVTPRSPA